MSADQPEMVIAEQNAKAPRFVSQSANEYHADTTRVSRSMIVDFIKSPWLYFKRYVERDPAYQMKVTDDMNFGTLFHAIVLEGKKFHHLVKLIPDHVLSDAGERRGTAYKQWASITPDAGSYLRPKEIEADRDLVTAMHNSLKACKPAMDLLQKPGGKNEQTIHWSYGDIELRTRIDRLIDGDCIIDLKTARTCDLGKIEASLEWDGYYIQAATYQMAVEAKTGKRLPFRFIFDEKAVPYRTVVVEMDQAWIDDGRREVESALDRLQRCADTGDWAEPSSREIILMKRNPNHAKFKWYIGDDE